VLSVHRVAAIADDRRARDEPVVGLGDRQRAPTAAHAARVRLRTQNGRIARDDDAAAWVCYLASAAAYEDRPACAATSAAKSVFFFSRPSPSSNRTKRRTRMFSPIFATSSCWI